MTNAKYKYNKWRWIGAFVLTMLWGAPPSLAQEQCDAQGVVFGFFNGVQTTLPQARDARRLLEALYGPITPAGEPITYELFYNDTQGFADFVETFDQRLQEHGGLLAGRFELFFSATRGEGSWWTALTSAIPSLVGFLDDLFNLSRAALMRELTKGLGTPNMGEVAARHREQIDLWAGLQKKMLFLAHSQGNLFVNQAYAHAQTRADANAVKVVHVAPASPMLSGPHTLADKDLVINALRLTGSVAPNTDEILPYLDRPPGLNGSRDLIGHGLLEIYLNSALATSGSVRGHVLAALRELDALPRLPWQPFPDFLPASGPHGPYPAAVYAPVVASHVLDRVEWQSSSPASWTRVDGGRWNLRPRTQEEWMAGGWENVYYVGKGMGGYSRCTWGVHPVDGWEEPYVVLQECVDERIPQRISLQPKLPDELIAHVGAPVGTVVTLSTMTFSRTDMGTHLNTRLVTEKDSPHARVRFFSRVLPLWSNGYGPETYWEEAYQESGGELLNPEAFEAWWAAEREHEAAESLRHERYLEAFRENERRRVLCEGTG